MDIRSRSNRFTGVFISFVIITVISVGVILTLPWINRRMDARLDFNQEGFGSELAAFSYSLYWRTVQKRTGTNITPIEVFYPEFSKSTEGGGKDAPSDIAVQEGAASEGAGTAVSSDTADETMYISSMMNDFVESWYHQLQNSGLDFLLYDQQTGERYSNTAVDLFPIVEGSENAEELYQSYKKLLTVRFDSEGAQTIMNNYGMDEKIGNSMRNWGLEVYMYNLASNIEADQLAFGKGRSPENITIVYGVPDGSANLTSIEWESVYNFQEAGFQFVYIIAMLFTACSAVAMSIGKPGGFGQGRLKNASLEFCTILFVLSFFFYDVTTQFAYGMANGILSYRMTAYEQVPEAFAKVAEIGLCFGTLFLALGLIYLSFVPVGQLYHKGINRYLCENIWAARTFLRFTGWVRRKYQAFMNIDLTEKGNKKIFKIVLVNFLILLILCSFWFFGVLLLIGYSIGLFFIMRKYYQDLSMKHQKLLDAAKRMADGNLDVNIEGDLGLFNPMKEALATIQSGFKKAVDEEVKSQHMKTELITNVSHDLKTPLTAIITYVGLLKDEAITEEDRRSYIDTLDRKSQRLKRLIEDLFEMSKASSRNMVLDIVDIDIASLLKQIHFELSDRLDSSGIDFKFRLPENKVVLKLDSSKTYRIFENLLVNITKYAMPGSRAYVVLETGEDYAEITLKNIAAEEMEFSPDEISERFVRGDRSRNTEGSGLGLAIARNFVELQNGKMDIVIDGDLFKVIIRFPYDRSCFSEEIEV